MRCGAVLPPVVEAAFACWVAVVWGLVVAIITRCIPSGLAVAIRGGGGGHFDGSVKVVKAVGDGVAGDAAIFFRVVIE